MALRVTFILPVFPRTPIGGFRVVYEYANRLTALGCQVTVVHERWREGRRHPLRHLREQARDHRNSRAPHQAIPWLPIDPQVRLPIVPTLTPDHIPPADVVVATHWKTATLLPHLAPAHGAPHHLVQGYETWNVPNPAPVNEALLLPIPKITVSTHLTRVLTNLGVHSGQITTIPNGLDHTTYHPPPRSQPRTGVAVLLSDSTAKDSPTALAALHQVHAKYPALQVRAFGVIPQPRRLPPWIHYTQGLTGKALADRVYRQCAIYLCSSSTEGWGFPAAEAMACGAAVVSTRNGGVEDFCHHNKTALLVNVGDRTAMAAAILRLLRNETLRTHLTTAAQATTATMDWQSSATTLLATLTKAT
ncbi:glycosyltransferase family 4 protein [Crossiella sp. CA198]|uniref:glycosyltransferase family 4 protein n=1 Tax=Crossiella sp. CA198 TaxID=3455607 RepID=UPI003F8D4CA9